MPPWSRTAVVISRTSCSGSRLFSSRIVSRRYRSGPIGTSSRRAHTRVVCGRQLRPSETSQHSTWDVPVCRSDMSTWRVPCPRLQGSTSLDSFPSPDSPRGCLSALPILPSCPWSRRCCSPRTDGGVRRASLGVPIPGLVSGHERKVRLGRVGRLDTSKRDCAETGLRARTEIGGRRMRWSNGAAAVGRASPGAGVRLALFLAVATASANDFGYPGNYAANNYNHEEHLSTTLDSDLGSSTDWVTENTYDPHAEIAGYITLTYRSANDARVYDVNYGDTGWYAAAPCLSGATIGGSGQGTWCKPRTIRYNRGAGG